MSNKKINELDEIRNYIGEVNKEITQNNSRNIIAYSRVSDLKQIENYSIDTQLNSIKRDAKENDFKIIKKFEVLGESSKKGSKRPSIIELLDFIKTTKHKVHSVVVFHSNRFTRDGSFGADFLDEIIKKGIGFKDLNSPNNIFNGEGRLRQINAFYDAEQDNLTRKKFINTTIIEKLKDGYTMRRPAFGYSMTYIGKEKKQKIIINEDGKKLKQAFQLKLNYGYSNVIISEKLNDLGIQMNAKRLGRIFKNVYYCGLIKDKRLVESNGIIEGRHPKMITLEEYKIINNVNGARKRGVQKTDVKELPLRKHLICSCCNKKLTGYRSSRGQNLFYYKCGTKGCKLNRNVNKVHQSYSDLLNELSFDSKLIPQLTKILKSVFKKINNSNKLRRKEINESINKLKKERFGTIKNMNTFSEDRDLYKELIVDYDNKLNGLEEQLDEIRIGIDNINNDAIEALQYVSDLPNIWSQSDLQLKMRLQELIFPDGVYYNKKSNKLIPVNINPIFNIYRGFKDFIDSDEYLTYTHQLNQKNDENSGENRTDFLIKNTLVYPIKSIGYSDFDDMGGLKKIPLVVLLSDRSNIFANKLLDSMIGLIQLIELMKNTKS